MKKLTETIFWSPTPPNLELIWKFEKMAASMAGHQIMVIKKKSTRSSVKQIQTTFCSISLTYYELFFSVTISKCELCKTFKPEMHGIGKTDKEHKY